jgi:hypothetical protein
VCIPTRGALLIPFVLDVFLPLVTRPLDFCIIQYIINYGHSIERQRNLLARDAVFKLGADYVWFIDDDQLFSGINVVAALRRLMDVNAPIVSGLTRLKKPGLPYSAVLEGPDGKPHPLETLTETVIDVTGVGSYCMLVKREVFEKMPPPWYQFQFNLSNELSEDFYFCEKARALGYKIKVHTAVILDHICHTGECVIKPDGKLDISPWQRDSP